MTYVLQSLNLNFQYHKATSKDSETMHCDKWIGSIRIQKPQCYLNKEIVLQGIINQEIKENSKGSTGSKCKSYYPQAKEEQKIWKLMTRRGPCPQPRLRSSPLRKGHVYDRNTKSAADKETCQRERDSAVLQKQPMFWSMRAAWSWFTEAAHHCERLWMDQTYLEVVTGEERMVRNATAQSISLFHFSFTNVLSSTK